MTLQDMLLQKKEKEYIKMDNAFNTPAQVLDANMKAGEAKAKLPILKCILLGIMAGAFIAFGGASSNAAVHNIANQGLSKTLVRLLLQQIHSLASVHPIHIYLLSFCLRLAHTIRKV